MTFLLLTCFRVMFLDLIYTFLLYTQKNRDEVLLLLSPYLHFFISFISLRKLAKKRPVITEGRAFRSLRFFYHQSLWILFGCERDDKYGNIRKVCAASVVTIVRKQQNICGHRKIETILI
jgi:hypothetical protein